MSTANETGQFQKEAYIRSFSAARNRLLKTKVALLDWTYGLDQYAASELIKIEPLLAKFPYSKGKVKDRIEFVIQTSEKRYGCLAVVLRTDAGKIDLCKLNRDELVSIFRRYCLLSEARKHADSFLGFIEFNRRVAALRFLGVDAGPVPKGGPNLPKWIEYVHAYGVACQPKLAAAFDTFWFLSEELDDAIFTFNGEAGRPRYRALRCSYTVDDFDPLGPFDPAIKVISFIKAATGYRRYNSLTDFKKALKRKRISHALHRQLGREPEKDEVTEAIKALRERQENPFLTKDVIRACYLGRSIRPIFAAQKSFVAAMEPWAVLRQQLQALL